MANRLNIKMLEDYKELQFVIPKVLKAYYINISALTRETGVSHSRFYKVLTSLKKRDGEHYFTVQEMEKIVEFLNK